MRSTESILMLFIVIVLLTMTIAYLSKPSVEGYEPRDKPWCKYRRESDWSSRCDQNLDGSDALHPEYNCNSIRRCCRKDCYNKRKTPRSRRDECKRTCWNKRNSAVNALINHYESNFDKHTDKNLIMTNLKQMSFGKKTYLQALKLFSDYNNEDPKWDILKLTKPDNFDDNDYNVIIAKVSDRAPSGFVPMVKINQSDQILITTKGQSFYLI